MTPASWHSYPSIFNLGHAALVDLLTVPVVVEEKVDGSQFSFCKTEDGELLARSKGAIINIDTPNKLFTKACQTVKDIADKLHPNFTYRCEYLAKPKHNTLAYDRVPEKNLVVFDVEFGDQQFLNQANRAAHVEDLGLECIPVVAFYQPGELTIDILKNILNNYSFLGKQKIEGVVIKPKYYDLFGKDHKVLMGKYVSEQFKEAHKVEWKVGNPGPADIITILATRYKTDARWQKSVQHLREAGLLEDSPKDIGRLITEVPVDLDKDCQAEITRYLYQWAWPQIKRKVTAGLPEWYKQQLLEKQFAHDTGEDLHDLVEESR